MWNLSHVQLGLLYVTAVIFGANVIIICWNASQRRSVWGPIMGALAKSHKEQIAYFLGILARDH